MTIPQTTYPDNQALGVEGQLGDGAADRHTVTRVNTTADMFFGQAVEEILATDNEVETPGVATSLVFGGITHHSHAIDAHALAAGTGIPQNNPANVLRKGRVLVVLEATVTKGQAAFYRFQNAGALPEKVGRFRSDIDGTAKVVTATPTAVNDTDYGLEVRFPDGAAYNFAVQGDASATATEINDDFRTQMAANAAFTARVVATGTTTLILTGQLAGEDFLVDDSGAGAWASITDTTPAAPDARAANTAFFQTGGGASDLAILEVNLPN